MSKSALKTRLQEMAQLAIFSNRISEVHEKNLKSYPFVFFNDVDMVEIDYDLGHGINIGNKEVNHSSRITYRLVLDESKNQNMLDKRFFALEVSVRDLFWKDVKLEVYFNGKKVYESKDAR